MGLNCRREATELEAVPYLRNDGISHRAFDMVELSFGKLWKYGT